jgi:hypothetical protein
MQFIHLDRLQGLLELVQLQLVEVQGSLAGPLQQSLHRAGIDLADIGGRLDGTAMPQALDDPNHREKGQLAVLQQRALAFTEPLLANITIQSTDGLVLAHALSDRQIAGPEDVERWTVRIRAGEELQRPSLGLGHCAL